MGTAQVGSGGSIALDRGNYQMQMRFDVPRAQVVSWTVQCPGIERTGVVGESFEAYRTRRLAELQRMVEQDRQRLAAVTNVVAGQVGARAQVHTPGATVQAEAQAPAGEAIADQAIQPIHELPIGDVGAGSYQAKIHLQTMQDGACTVTTQAADPIGGLLAVDRIRDLEAEAQARQVAQRATAIDVRARVRTRLVAFGADAQARERRLAEHARQVEEERQRRAALEAQAAAEREARLVAARAERATREEETRLRLEAEARVRWEAEAPERARLAMIKQERAARLRVIEQERRARLVLVEQARLEKLRITETEHRMRIVILERQRTAAMTVRGGYVAWLVGTCGADPHRYARLQHERTERTRRIEVERIEHERRLELELELRAQHAQQRQATAFAVRAQLSGYLVSAGARLRPARPAAIVEVAGGAPFDGARWESGTWTWIQGDWQWQWRKGGWVDSTRFGAAGGESVVRAPVAREPVRTTTTTSTSTTTSTTAIEVPSGVTISAPQGSISIDVRPKSPKPAVRDHRRRDSKDDAPPARTRDHRRR